MKLEVVVDEFRRLDEAALREQDLVDHPLRGLRGGLRARGRACQRRRPTEPTEPAAAEQGGGEDGADEAGARLEGERDPARALELDGRSDARRRRTPSREGFDHSFILSVLHFHSNVNLISY